MMIFFLFLPLSYCFFSTLLLLCSHLVLDLLFSYKEFQYFSFSNVKKKKTRYDAEYKKRRETSFDSMGIKKKKLYCGCLTERVYDDDFSSENTCTQRKNRRNEKYIFLIRLKIKRKKIKNCLVNISSSYPSSEIGRFFRM